ncbi:MAG: hypothetical protein AB7G37_11765 [Solirubrobacteraceae bacterium]
MLPIVIIVLTGVAVASFLLALRASARAPRGTELASVGSGTVASHVDRLTVGAHIDCDDRSWTVVGAQRDAAPTASPTGATSGDRATPGRALWHLEDSGQRALLEVDPAVPDEIVVSVGAEASRDLDPDRPLVWRDLTWRPLDGSAPEPDDAPTQPRTRAVRGEGIRHLRHAHEPLASTATLERAAFANPELPRRRLTFLREVTDGGTPGPWAVWIGDRLPVSMLDVYPPQD